jgi:uncharacterized protein
MNLPYATVKNLSGKRALILSATEDMTSQIGLKLALEGCHVFAVSPDAAGLERLSREIKDTHGEFQYLHVDDLTDYPLPELVHQIQRFAPSIHYLIDVTQQEDFSLLTALDSFYNAKGLGNVVVINETEQVDLPEFNNDIKVSQVFVQEAGNQETYEILRLIFGVNETLNLLIHDDYRKVNSVGISEADGEIIIRLYRGTGSGKAEALMTLHKGSVPGVYIKHTERGRGVFAARDFGRGELVLETTGKALQHQTEHSLQIGWDSHFEPDAPVRLINHSCEPSLGVKTNIQGIPDFFAFRDIRKGEEVTFDYAMTEYTHYPREDASLEFNLTCLCGSVTCRGKLGYYSELSDELKRKYQGFVSDYLTEESNQPMFLANSRQPQTDQVVKGEI